MPTADEKSYVLEILQSLSSSSSSLLWLDTGQKGWTQRWLSDSGIEVTIVNWQQVDALAGQQFDAVMALGVLDVSSQPDHLVSKIADITRPGGFWLFGCLNSQAMGQHRLKQLGSISPFPAGPSWQPETLDIFVNRFGRQSIWQGTTPLSWPVVSGCITTMPPLIFQPAGLKSV